MVNKNTEFKRGFFSPEIKKKMDIFFQKESTQTELRLTPFLFVCLINNGILDGKRINEDEFAILAEWDSKNYISFNRKNGDVGNYIVKIKSTDFFKFIVDILFTGYIDKSEINMAGELEENIE